jgi:hypothetical protein
VTAGRSYKQNDFQVLKREFNNTFYCHYLSFYLGMNLPSGDQQFSPLINVSCIFFSPATAVSRKSVHDMTTARHFLEAFFVIYIRIFTMKIAKFQLCGNNSACAGAFQLWRGRAPAQLRGNIATGVEEEGAGATSFV